MLLSAVSVLVVAQSSSEIREGLMNNPVYVYTVYVHPSGWGQTAGGAVVTKCVSIALLTRAFVRHGSPTRGQPVCIIRPAATFVRALCTEAAVSMTQQFRRSAIPLTVIMPRSALQPAQNNRRGPLPQKVCRPMPYGMRKVNA